MMAFHVNQRVVCVDATNNTGFIQKGATSTVTMVGMIGDEPGISVAEAPIGIPDMLAYYASRFRPVRTTSIDTFLAMLSKPPVRKRERA